LTAKSIIGTIERFEQVVLADPNDDKVLETARRGKAEFMVKGDRHLFYWRDYEETKIVTVPEIAKTIR